MLALEAKAASAKAAAENAEAVASAAMSAAESAVREEMEAAAVAKSTASALNSVIAELKDLGVSFETSDKLERTLQARGVSRVRPLSPLSTLSSCQLPNGVQTVGSREVVSCR